MTDPLIDLLVVLACGVGAVCRYLVDRAVSRAVAARTGARFPLGTLLVNVSGSLLLGVVAGLAVRDVLPSGPALVLSVGFAGGYTTLSTWAWETLQLAERGQARQALANVLVTFAAGLAAAAAGLALGHLLASYA